MLRLGASENQSWPYRRNPPKLSEPTAADYRSMIAAVEDMKAVLEWRVSEGVRTADYDAAKAFLDRLGKELAARLQPAGSPG